MTNSHFFSSSQPITNNNKRKDIPSFEEPNESKSVFEKKRIKKIVSAVNENKEENQDQESAVESESDDPGESEKEKNTDDEENEFDQEDREESDDEPGKYVMPNPWGWRQGVEIFQYTDENERYIKHYRTDYVLDWISFHILDDGCFGTSFEEYPELDLNKVIARANDLQLVVDKLVAWTQENRWTISKNRCNHMVGVITYLVQKGNLRISDENENFLNTQLDQALEDGEDEAIRFYIKQGAGKSTAINAAIQRDLVDMLELLEVEVSHQYVELAVEYQSLKVLHYFLEEDFNESAEMILREAAQEGKGVFVEAVLEHAETGAVSYLIDDLVKAGGEDLVPIFFKYFDVAEILSELQECGKDDLVKVVSKQAAHYLSESDKNHMEIACLLSDFNVQLNFHDSLLSYPKEPFAGHKILKDLRNALDKNSNLTDEHRVSANLVGMPMSTQYSLFESSAYHQPEVKKSEHYIRSEKHSLRRHVTVKRAQFTPDETLPESRAKKGYGNEATLGLYLTPLDSLNVHHGIQSERREHKSHAKVKPADLYDLLLNEKLDTCKKIASNLKLGENPALVVNVYNDYPCLMVFVKTPPAAGKSATGESFECWVEIITRYFIASANFEAHKKGLKIEILPRASFGFHTPTIAVCESSFRLNVGLVPEEYAQVLQDCLLKLNAMLLLLDKEYKKDKSDTIDLAVPEDAFTNTKSFKKYLTQKDKPIPKPKNMLDLVWAEVDSCRGTTAKNLTRTPFARVGFSVKVYEGLSKAPDTDQARATVFLDALRWGIKRLSVIGSQKLRLTFKQDDHIKKVDAVLVKHAKIKDDQFFSFVYRIIKAIRERFSVRQVTGLFNESEAIVMTAIESCIENETVAFLYSNIELLNEIVFAGVILSAPAPTDDPFGSDSEEEDECQESKVSVYTMKVIGHNGMRSTWGALHAGMHHLHSDYLKSNDKYNVALLGAYYETEKIKKLLVRFNTVSVQDAEIVIHDTNECVKAGETSQTVDERQLAQKKVLIIDTTSATLVTHRKWVELLRASPKMEVLFLISTGIKHEQNGADKNPYGTIRVFTKNKKQLNAIMAFIKSTEKPIQSVVSHAHRRTMGEMGFTPSSVSIFKATFTKLNTNESEKQINIAKPLQPI